MDEAAWRERLVVLLRERAQQDASHDLGHLHRVWANARHIMDQEPPCERLVVLAACYLHDCVVLPKDHPQRHRASRLAATEARRELVTLGFPAGHHEAVAHAIEAHSFSAGIPVASREAAIVQDADRIEALGAIGIARCFHTGGQLGSGLFDDADPLAERRPLDDRAWCLDHFAAKLLGLPATMHSAGGRALAEERAAVLRTFRAQLLHELDHGAGDADGASAARGRPDPPWIAASRRAR